MNDTTLLPILRSRTQGNLLALLFLNPGKSFSITEAAAQIGVSRPGLSQEASRLREAGLIQSTVDGRSTKIQAETGSILSEPLTNLLAVTYGPLPVLNRELEKVRGIETAYIYGSWAARYSGEGGSVPNDIDLLVVGSADQDELHEAGERAEKVLLREVNIRRVSAKAWAKSEDPFLKTLRESRLVKLSVGEMAK